MKTTKSLLTIVILLFIASTALAQGFGIRAGVNLQNINGKDFEGDKLENDLTMGFNAGVNYEILVGTDIYFQPGLLFSTKGTKSTETVLSQDIESKLSLSYIELPLNIVFKPLLGTGHMLLGFGPYVGYGVGGKYTLDTPNTSSEWDIEFTNEVTESDVDNDAFFIKPFDAGANFIIGYEMANMLSIQLNAQLGLIDINPKYPVDDEATLKNTGFGLSLGYRF